MMRSGIFASTQSDDNGNFVLGGLDAMGDKTEFVVQAIQENGSKDVYLKLDDNGKTLYWNPDIIISGGDQSHRFDFTLPPRRRLRDCHRGHLVHGQDHTHPRPRPVTARALKQGTRLNGMSTQCCFLC